MIVAAGAEVGQLRDANVIANLDGHHIVEPSLLANPAMIADGQSPRELDADVWLDHEAAPDAGAEQAQQTHLQAADGKPPVLEKRHAAKVPERSNQ